PPPPPPRARPAQPPPPGGGMIAVAVEGETIFFLSRIAARPTPAPIRLIHWQNLRLFTLIIPIFLSLSPHPLYH
ncbi:MAG: hypothetical protein ACK4ZT_04295, partial [Microcystis sp.]|uniref:hypothetical protein n=1 Tax=Microcystis sp. TaxID=1127 RepID=UPI00391B76F8